MSGSLQNRGGKTRPNRERLLGKKKTRKLTLGREELHPFGYFGAGQKPKNSVQAVRAKNTEHRRTSAFIEEKKKGFQRPMGLGRAEAA